MPNENDKNELTNNLPLPANHHTEIEQLDLAGLNPPVPHGLTKKVNQVIETENSHEKRIKRLEGSQPIDAGTDKRLNKLIRKRIFNLIGGVDSNAYRSNYYAKVSHDLRHSMYDYLDVAATKDLTKEQLEKAINFVGNWRLDFGTEMKVAELNSSERVPTKHAFKFDDAGRERMEKFISQPAEAFERLERLLALPAERFDQIIDNFSENYDEPEPGEPEPDEYDEWSPEDEGFDTYAAEDDHTSDSKNTNLEDSHD